MLLATFTVKLNFCLLIVTPVYCLLSIVDQLTVNDSHVITVEDRRNLSVVTLVKRFDKHAIVIHSISIFLLGYRRLSNPVG